MPLKGLSSPSRSNENSRSKCEVIEHTVEVEASVSEVFFMRTASSWSPSVTVTVHKPALRFTSSTRFESPTVRNGQDLRIRTAKFCNKIRVASSLSPQPIETHFRLWIYEIPTNNDVRKASAVSISPRLIQCGRRTHKLHYQVTLLSILAAI
jgi:hypothetical protein